MSKQVKRVHDNDVYNPNLICLHDTFDNKQTGCLLEGSSRSGKTWSGIDFGIWLCSVYSGMTWNILRGTHNSFNTTLYDDFNRRFPQFGLSAPFADNKAITNFKLYNNQINFLGSDNEAVLMGVGSDFVWFNEMLDIPNAAFDQMEMRCRKFWWGDYNPKATVHWVFDKVWNRADVTKLHTTLLDNTHVSKAEKRKILGYEPTHPDVRGKAMSDEEKKKHPHSINIKAGTADDYMWNVYGLGLRSAPEGLVFQNVEWIKEFPDKGIEQIYYGNDFGWENNPTAIVKVGRSGNNLYLQKMFYEPTASTNQYFPMLDALPAGFHGGLVADPGGGGAGMISEARRKGYRVLAVNKFPGSILYGISVLKKFKLHLVDCPEWRREQANYKRRIVNGVKLDEPVDAFNDLWDAARYVALTFLRAA